MRHRHRGMNTMAAVLCLLLLCSGCLAVAAAEKTFGRGAVLGFGYGGEKATETGASQQEEDQETAAGGGGGGGGGYSTTPSESTPDTPAAAAETTTGGGGGGYSTTSEPTPSTPAAAAAETTDGGESTPSTPASAAETTTGAGGGYSSPTPSEPAAKAETKTSGGGGGYSSPSTPSEPAPSTPAAAAQSKTTQADSSTSTSTGGYGMDPAGEPEYGLNQKAIDDILREHNAFRAREHVPPLAWNATLAKFSQQYAETLKKECKSVHSTSPYGENLMLGTGAVTWKATVDEWSDEKRSYHYGSNTCDAGKMCGHYTAVVWKGTTSVGCGRVKCDSGDTMLMCSYWPPGNYDGVKPY